MYKGYKMDLKLVGYASVYLQVKIDGHVVQKNKLGRSVFFFMILVTNFISHLSCKYIAIKTIEIKGW